MSITWTELQPIDTNSHTWSAIAMSSSGLILVACSPYDGVFKSIDGGVTWSDITPSGMGDRNWTTIDISEDGQVIFAGMYQAPPDGICVISLDGGATWIIDKSPPDSNWYLSLQVSGDGTTLIAANSFYQYISTNYGTSWTQINPYGGVASSVSNRIYSDGTILLFGGESSKGVRISFDSGASWTNIAPVASLSVRQVGMSDDGQKILVTGYSTPSYHAWYSSNGGSSWTDLTFESEVNWSDASVSPDGSIMLLGAPTTSKHLYVSYDSAATWELNNPNAEASSGSALYANNDKIYVAFSDRLWTNIINPNPPSGWGNKIDGVVTVGKVNTIAIINLQNISGVYADMQI